LYWHLARISAMDALPRLLTLAAGQTAKLHLGDTGVACALLGLSAETLANDRALLGQLLESFVFQELRRQASWHEEQITF